MTQSLDPAAPAKPATPQLPTAPEDDKLVVVMVGLPARGKSYTGRRLARYLSWLGYRTRVFNVGEYRRSRLEGRQDHEFFDPSNESAVEARRELAVAALADMIGWLKHEGDVAIYDATNSTRSRRDRIRAECIRAGVRMLFIENVCDDQDMIERNIRATKLGSPDYAGEDPDEAVRDFRARIAHYDKAYQPLTEEEGSFIKLINGGDTVIVHKNQGYLAGRVLSFLMNLRHDSPPIWLTRHGESISNLQEKVGGDSALAPRGQRYSRSLAAYMHKAVAVYYDSTGGFAPEQLSLDTTSEDELTVWTSSLRRTIETASTLQRHTVQWRALDEIQAGICDGMSYAEIKTVMPDEFDARKRDKFRYRYPRGESYQDVIERLNPVIIEMERRRKPLLIVAHQAILRALYGYLMGIAQRDVPHLSVPLHSVIKLTPHAYGCHEERITLAPKVPNSSSSS